MLLQLPQNLSGSNLHGTPGTVISDANGGATSLGKPFLGAQFLKMNSLGKPFSGDPSLMDDKEFYGSSRSTACPGA